jgi:hypothetical protein
VVVLAGELVWVVVRGVESEGVGATVDVEVGGRDVLGV